ncbi:metallophosphoesterase family protein [Butyrivibrio sp. WCE2006]|uniref:metallophosphoesterase family protein n=1 Tax=Butyrivibrio sp. WCE2006 TaxID=1410611 RepID=UPI000678DFBA|nr:metallophosphoesterase family protein [Butyrivibrio sp. WCE2006]
MDIAVFSDIHGNSAALQACIDYCMGKGITNYILLGDFISDCPGVKKTMELIYVLKQYFTCYIVRGNREEYMLNYRKNGETGWEKGSGSGSLLYTYERLTDKDFNFFDSLPIYGIWNPKKTMGFEYCHGSPTSASELLFGDKRNTKKIMNKLKTDILFHGHTHVQESFLYRGKRAVNPGALGLPRNKNCFAEFAIVHSGRSGWEEELIQVKYDRHALIKEFQTSGLMEYAPAWAAATMHTIRTGIDLSEAILLQAMRLCEAERGIVRWPVIPEKYWAEALKQNFIDLAGKDIPKPRNND